MSEQPVIWWVRRDLRLSDNPTLQKVLDAGGPVLPVFLCDEVLEGMGAAPKWRFGLGAVAFDKALREVGSRLIFRRGPAAKTLLALAEETEAGQVLWTRNYDPERREGDTDVKAALKDAGLQAESVAGHVLNEPWSVETGSGGFYKVYTPFWKAVRVRDFPEPISAPSKIPAPTSWPQSDDIDGWGLGDAMARGADVVRGHLCLGESAARGRLGAVIADGIGAYDKNRDRLDLDGTSGLSEPLAYGEIGIRTCWHAGARAMADGKPGAETFLKELIWRDFATHLVFHTPHITSGNWRPEWDAFPWNEDERLAEVRAWKRGRTGVRVVDAAMRELYVSGRMHNRTRMLVASYLTKPIALSIGIRLQTPWAGNGPRALAPTRRPISASSTPRPRPKSSTRPRPIAVAGSPRGKAIPAPRR